MLTALACSTTTSAQVITTAPESAEHIPSQRYGHYVGDRARLLERYGRILEIDP
ncbi:MAG: hypothetical protein J7530_11870 [Novosphingobium sp.]|nr:hypothetical protein [Novosphingobium sp.]